MLEYSMRIFVGIELPEETQDAIFGVLSKLGPDFGVPRSTPHITLKSPQYHDTTGAVEKTLEQIVEDFENFEVSLGNPEFFDDLYFVLSAQSETLHDLHTKIAKAHEQYNETSMKLYEYEKYNPHVTIAKISEDISVEQKATAMEIANKNLTLPLSFTVKNISIYVLDEETNKYKIARNISLGN